MPTRIAINGFGRIGRLTLRNLLEKEGVEVVAINDLTDNATLAHLFKYDTAHGIYAGEVSATEDKIIINGHEIVALSERNPAALPWAAHNIDVVLECTGIFVSKDKAGQHIEAGAKKVIISAPAKGSDVQTIVIGVNDHELDKTLTVFSNASCTTNCLAPLAKVLDENFGFVQGNASTIHAYTADQRLQDAPHKDLRRARAAALNIVPTSTGAGSAVGLVYPKMKGRLSAIALRVPTITGSLVEVNCLVEKDTTAAEINAAFKAAADGPMKGVLQYADWAVVSSDIIANKHSSVFDPELTEVHGKWVKVVSWYDNEAGYSARLADLATMVL